MQYLVAPEAGQGRIEWGDKELNLIFLRPALIILLIITLAGCAQQKAYDDLTIADNDKIRYEPLPFLEKDEITLFNKTKKIPASNLEDNLTYYYQLKKINPHKDLYANKFNYYNKKFIKTGKQFKSEQWLVIEGGNAYSVPYPGYAGERVGITIPRGYPLMIVGYTVYKGLFWDILFYKVNVNGQSVWISDLMTDRVLTGPYRIR